VWLNHQLQHIKDITWGHRQILWIIPLHWLDHNLVVQILHFWLKTRCWWCMHASSLTSYYNSTSLLQHTHNHIITSKVCLPFLFILFFLFCFVICPFLLFLVCFFFEKNYPLMIFDLLQLFQLLILKADSSYS
jgi:hypothetical protein